MAKMRAAVRILRATGDFSERASLARNKYGLPWGVLSDAANAFVEAWAGTDGPEIAERVDRIIERALTGHPDLKLDTQAFARHLASVTPADGDVTAQLDAVAAEDLYLVFGSLGGDERASRRLVETFGPELDRGARKLKWTGLTTDEFRQIGLSRLFAPGRDGRIRLATYTGQATLRSWMRVIAGRLAVDLMRAARPEATLDPDRQPALASYRLGDASPTHRAEVQAAYEAAFSKLPDDQRRLLRHQLIHGLTTEDLGSMLGIHRTTAARRVDKARANLHQLARDELAARVGGHEATVDSILADARSRLELSVERLLASRS